MTPVIEWSNNGTESVATSSGAPEFSGIASSTIFQASYRQAHDSNALIGRSIGITAVVERL
jgi:hypothetical protein